MDKRIDDRTETIEIRKTALLSAAQSIGCQDKYNSASHIIEAAQRFEHYLRTGEYV